MPDTISINLSDAGLRAALSELTPQLRSRVMRQGTDAMARIVRKRARQMGFGFTDRSGTLRRSIRVERARAGRGRRGRPAPSRLTAGGLGARQAYLVEYGHGGPIPAPAHSYLRAALRETASSQARAATGKIRDGLSSAMLAAARKGRSRSRSRRR